MISGLVARHTRVQGGLSALGGRPDLIFHRSTAHPWSPSLSPHGRPESCSVNTPLKYVACQPPLSTMLLARSLGLTIKRSPQLQMLAAVFNPLDASLSFLSVNLHRLEHLSTKLSLCSLNPEVLYWQICTYIYIYIYQRHEKGQVERRGKGRTGRSSKQKMLDKHSASPLFIALRLYALYKQETKSVYDHLARSGILIQVRIFPQIPGKLGWVLLLEVESVMYGVELERRQREHGELHQHHYSARSNPI